MLKAEKSGGKYGVDARLTRVQELKQVGVCLPKPFCILKADLGSFWIFFEKLFGHSSQRFQP